MNWNGKLNCLIITLMLVVGIGSTLQAQNISSYGVELQVYPTGVIPGITFEYGISQQATIGARVGYNIVRHRDLGVHEDERGGGVGISVDYQYYLSEEAIGWFGGVRTDAWFNTIDWKDNIDMPNQVMGQTEIVVIQPTVRAGYALALNPQRTILLEPALSFGVEINTFQEGEDVGEGLILLVGVGLKFR